MPFLKAAGGFLKKHYRKLIFPVFLIVGIIRNTQIYTYQQSIGMLTMKGAFTLFVYISSGFCLAVAVAICHLIYESMLNRVVSVILCIIVAATYLLIAGYTIAYFRLL